MLTANPGVARTVLARATGVRDGTGGKRQAGPGGAAREVAERGGRRRLGPGLTDGPGDETLADGAGEAVRPPLSVALAVPAGPVVPAGALQAETTRPTSRPSSAARYRGPSTCRARRARPTLGPAGVSAPRPRRAVGKVRVAIGP